MYYNKFLGRMVVDLIDYFILSTMFSIYLTNYLKFYFSEESKMERLRQDLINKSKLINSSSQSSQSITPSSATRVRKIVNFALRGGNQELYSKTEEQIKGFVLYLLVILRKRVNNGIIFNLIVSGARFYLQLIRLIWRIKVSYCVVDPLTGQTIVVTIIAGSATGFTVSWIGVGATLFANLLGIVFLSRSLARQLIHNREYREFPNQVVNLIKNEEFQSRIVSIAEKIEDNKLKIKTLNWDQNSALKEAAERLGIFGENLNSGPIKSTENSLYKRYLEKKLVKTVEKVVDFEANSNIIDVDFVNKDRSINIPRIRSRD